jgi:hypothetical protein
MKKLFFLAVALLMTTAIFANETTEDRRPAGCRSWRIKIFGYTLVEHYNDACQNSDGNWDWGGNGSTPNVP